MFNNIPPITKNLIILNVLMFAATYIFSTTQTFDMVSTLGAYYPFSDNFKSYQIITHMFMHGDTAHIFFNMFALWMFGPSIERRLGDKRFLILYFAAGLGSFILFNLTNYIEAQPLLEGLSEAKILQLEQLSPYQMNNKLTQIYTIPMVGASGAIFGILAAFGVMFPNSVLMLIFPPIPMKAKYFIPIMVMLELYLAVNTQPGDNFAHYAHIGGAIIGFLLVRYWKKNQFNRWDR